MTNTFNFDEALRELNEAHKEFMKAKEKLNKKEGFCFDAFLAERHMTYDDYLDLSDEDQDKIGAEYEQRKNK